MRRWQRRFSSACLRRSVRRASDAAERKKGTEKRNDWGSFGKLSVIILARALGFTLCNTFIPLYWIHVLGTDEAAGSTALSSSSRWGRASPTAAV